MIISETNGREDIAFYPQTVNDGIKIGLLKAKLDKFNFTYYLEKNRLEIKQSDLIELLVADY